MFLSHGGWHCGHDEIRHARSMEDVRAWFSQPNTGTSETAAAPWWRTVQRVAPGIKTVVVRRDVPQVVESLCRFGFDRAHMTWLMTRLDRKLDQIEKRVPDVLSVRFNGLAHEPICRRVWEHCLPHPFDQKWWETMHPLNIQVDMAATVRHARAFQPQMLSFAKTAKEREIQSMRPYPGPFDGMEIRQEPFDTFLRDAVDLFAQHAFEVGEPPDAWKRKNLPLMHELNDRGELIVTTARSNGRMFGYLHAVLSQSLESPDIRTAYHTTFFASRDTRGLGMKMQRSSIAALKRAGVDELYLRAGTRGSGPKMGVLYRRLGAEDFGQYFKLQLKDAA
jgi:hypothetical protein